MFNQLKNLNQAWVIVSRHNGNTFFKRKRYATRLKNYPDQMRPKLLGSSQEGCTVSLAQLANSQDIGD